MSSCPAIVRARSDDVTAVLCADMRRKAAAWRFVLSHDLLEQQRFEWSHRVSKRCSLHRSAVTDQFEADPVENGGGIASKRATQSGEAS
jgi:hypothetical protein